MILALFSGGLDSTAMCNLLLARGEKLHIHHMHIENSEGRAGIEDVAVRAALSYWTSKGYQFTFTESKIKVPEVPGAMMFDSDAYNFIAGYLCSTHSEIKQVAVGATLEEQRQSTLPRIVRANKVLQAFTTAEKIYPVATMDKLDLYNSLPDELKSAFWSCRKPVYHDEYAEPCGQCKTCMDFKKIGIELKGRSYEI